MTAIDTRSAPDQPDRVCEAMLAVSRQEWGSASSRLEGVPPDLVHIAGSAAQREIFVKTLRFSLSRSSA